MAEVADDALDARIRAKADPSLKPAAPVASSQTSTDALQQTFGGQQGPGRTEPGRTTPVAQSPEDLALTARVTQAGPGLDITHPEVIGDYAGATPAERARMRAEFGAPAGRPVEGTRGQRVVSGKRELSDEELDERLKGASQPVAKTTAERAATPSEGTPDPEWFQNEYAGKELDGATEAVLHGVRQGVQETVTGPVQAALEQVAPETAASFTARLNEFEDQFQSMKDHPTAAFMGKVVGTTIGIMTGAGLVRGGMALAGVTPRLLGSMGLWGRNIAVGGALGATSYNADPEEQSREIEGVIGAGIGAVLGAPIAKAVQWGMKTLADNPTYNSFVQLMKDSAGTLTPSTTKLKNFFLDHYENEWKLKNENYTLRNSARQEVAPGFPREEMGAPAVTAMAGSRKAGVAPTPTTRSVAAQVDRELGGPEARAQAAVHEKKVEQFEKDMEEWKQEYSGVLPKAVSKSGKTPEQQARELIDSGQLPPPPVHPGEFEHEPVTPEQYEAAVTVVNRAWARSAKDAATRSQLVRMRGEMESAARSAAEEVGLNPAEYMRKSREAGAFHREHIAPLQKHFGATPSEVRGDPNVPGSGWSEAKFYDRTVRLIEGHDMRALRDFRKMMGARAEPEIQRIATREMLTSAENAQGKANPAKFAQYVYDHREALQELMGRRGVEELLGTAKVAERIAKEPARHGWLWKSIHHPWIGSVVTYEGVIHQQPGRTVTGLAILAAPHVLNGLVVGMSKLQGLPGVKQMLRAAANVKPDSPQMTTILKRIERESALLSGAAARTAAPAEPASPF